MYDLAPTRKCSKLMSRKLYDAVSQGLQKVEVHPYLKKPKMKEQLQE